MMLLQTSHTPYSRPIGAKELQERINHIFSRYPTPLLAANMDTRNLASIKLVESLGFKRTAFIPNADTFKGMTSDEYRYELTRERWEESRSAG
jgi:RimJ/RimL family protein N-acetyltransferase